MPPKKPIATPPHHLQKAVIASDFCTLFKKLSHPIRTHSEFEAAWDSCRMEALHYAGGSYRDTVKGINSRRKPKRSAGDEDDNASSKGVEGSVEEELEAVASEGTTFMLLEVATAYIALGDESDSPAATYSFGLLLAAFLYYTQPGILSNGKRHLIRMKHGDYHALLVALPRLDNNDLLTGILSCLAADGAIQLLPFVNNTASIKALVEGHQIVSVPLWNARRLDAETKAISAKLAVEVVPSPESVLSQSNNFQSTSFEVMASLESYRALRKGLL